MGSSNQHPLFLLHLPQPGNAPGPRQGKGSSRRGFEGELNHFQRIRVDTSVGCVSPMASSSEVSLSALCSAGAPSPYRLTRLTLRSTLLDQRDEVRKPGQLVRFVLQLVLEAPRLSPQVTPACAAGRAPVERLARACLAIAKPRCESAALRKCLCLFVVGEGMRV